MMHLKLIIPGHAKNRNGICIIFSHRYSGNLNPQMLKGADLYLYNIFKQYFGIYLTPITIKSFIGVWTDEWFDEWGDGRNTRIIGKVRLLQMDRER